ncbi:MAG: hypothetical protein J6K46_01260 [Sutterella sp.]|nr:hypothetical protein [Sutterella sp.]
MRHADGIGLTAAALAAGILITEFLAGTVGLTWFGGEVPCTMSGVERLAAAFAAVTLIFAALSGLIRRLAGLLLIQSLTGLWMCARHLAMQGTGDVGQGFGSTFLGLHGYGWSSLLFAALLFWLGTALVFARREHRADAAPMPAALRAAAGAASLILLLNAVTAMIANGPPPFAGVGIPDRLTMSSVPGRWSASFWERIAAGPRLSDRPLHGSSADDGVRLRPEDGPILPTAPSVSVSSSAALPTPFEDGALPRAFAWDPDGRRFGWAAEDARAAWTDRTMHRVTARAKADAVNGQTLDATAGAVWFRGRFITASRNKTLWALESAYGSAPETARGLSDGTGNVRLSWGKARPAVRTVRARDAYIQSFAADEKGGRLFMMTAPGSRPSGTVLITIDGTDLMPLSESPLRAAPGLAVKDGRHPGEYGITAAVWTDGILLVWCPRFAVLLTVDPDRAEVTSVRAVGGLKEVRSMTVRDGRLLFLQGGQDGLSVAAVQLNALGDNR